MHILGWTAGLLGIGAVGLAAYLYAPDKPRVALEALYPGEYRTVLGMRLRLRDTGPRDRPALILVHGFGSSLDTWEPWAEALSARYRVVRFDLPGFGLSGPDPPRDRSPLTAVARRSRSAPAARRPRDRPRAFRGKRHIPLEYSTSGIGIFLAPGSASRPTTPRAVAGPDSC